MRSSGDTVPSVRSRQSVTPCQSGVNHAITSSGAGRLEIGKNVPEKRNIGRMTNRKIAMNETIDSVRAAHAASGVVNDSPTRTVAGIASTPSGESTAPKAVMTRK